MGIGAKMSGMAAEASTCAGPIRWPRMRTCGEKGRGSSPPRAWSTKMVGCPVLTLVAETARAASSPERMFRASCRQSIAWPTIFTKGVASKMPVARRPPRSTRRRPTAWRTPKVITSASSRADHTDSSRAIPRARSSTVEARKAPLTAPTLVPETTSMTGVRPTRFTMSPKA